MTVSLASTEALEPPFFWIRPRALCAADAADYFVNKWLARGIEWTKLNEVDQFAFDETLLDYVHTCAQMHNSRD